MDTKNKETGELFLCATPIGNLEDMPVRAVRIMKEADLIAAEDTRNSIKLINHFEIDTPMTSYHEYNKVDKAKVLVDKMLAGQTVALITDAGTPGISDPGEELVRQAVQAGINVTSVPGPAACINALIISGLPTRRFVFEAFLPSDKKERAAVLEELSHETRTMIIYEAPHRLCRTLAELAEILGGDRQIAVCKELTKRHETVYRSDINGAVDYYNANEPRGEYVLVIAGLNREDIIRDKQDAWKEMPLEEHLKHYESQGIERREAIKLVAKDRGVPKREIYNMTLNFPK
ncbi:MAG TPA: 16S rRNA (cytidine(1402)-2'-O)-methyltransferase [Lachnospiraceae bacterium]|nr:16S rRNA (cytidine(1402)-2'-O)-methyltransferase [Lachnospiraceae bacterium]